MTRITEAQMVHYGNLVEWVGPARLLLRAALNHIPPTEVTLIRKIEALLATETVPITRRAYVLGTRRTPHEGDGLAALVRVRGEHD